MISEHLTRKNVLGCLLILPMLILFGITFMSSIGWDRLLEVMTVTFIAAIVLIMFGTGIGLLVSEEED